ncbi:MAG: hypothetical protein PHR51_00470 [Patescibacteria group bacterium]|nr:hypothetical protein [Patescibacteria group bacterium]
MLEMGRLETTRVTIDKRIIALQKGPLWPGLMKRNFELMRLGCDTHFFFVCVDKCYKLLHQLARELNDSDIRKLKKKLDKVFDIKTIRNHLEHIDERCIGYLNPEDRRNRLKKPIQDFGNFIGSDFSFNNKKFPSNKQSLGELQKIYRELIKILHDKYASKDRRFVENEQNEKRIQLIQKALKKAGFV